MIESDDFEPKGEIIYPPQLAGRHFLNEEIPPEDTD
ncbi:unannotated protein [freshwater metagenome]|uniref:Unannotated protein n=1 Tax=freshwater metagenome TaxID=449393 RepID=A0A6J6LQV1_9ZZZZ